MEKIRINENVTAYAFDELNKYITYVYLINKPTKLFLIDTFCGSCYLSGIIEDIQKYGYEKKDKELIVVNTHFHWDHIWGNSAFKGNSIVSHKLCKELIKQHWNEQMLENGSFLKGDNEMILPNVVFEDALSFKEEGIELFYTPGHTVDSLSVYDAKQQILFAGDNLEKPIVYVENEDIRTYIHTLQSYLQLDLKQIFSGHTINISVQDIKETITYLTKLQEGIAMDFEDDYSRNVHQQNRKIIDNKKLPKQT